MSLRVNNFSEVKILEDWSRSESESEKGDKLELLDAKLSDLPLGRMKFW